MLRESALNSKVFNESIFDQNLPFQPIKLSNRFFGKKAPRRDFSFLL
jgi:hypothetical protein